MAKGVVVLLAESPKQAFGHMGAVVFGDRIRPIRTPRIQDVDIVTPGQGFEATWQVLFFIFDEDDGRDHGAEGEEVNDRLRICRAGLPA